MDCGSKEKTVAYLYYRESDQDGSTLEKSYLIFNPETKLQSWRFFTYMLLHTSFIHLMYNLFVQLLVGVPLERVYGSLRILIIYFAGGLSGNFIINYLSLFFVRSHLYMPFSTEQNGSPAALNVPPENQLLVGKDTCNFVDND
uniref:Peptidase S54 rhomboid domain-containing protein n=1 Tax=Romanomermis culicivorax TaxID=13658 RepID=A0A915KT70_ROMCU